jgi:NADH-quinone oxidoreductase subunit L
MLLQQPIAGGHPLSGTVAEWIWLVPVLPLLGFVINGLISLRGAARVGPPDPSADGGHGHHGDPHAGGHAEHGAADHSGGGAHGDDHHPVARHPAAGLVSFIGPAVLALSFALAVAIFLAMLGVERDAPFVKTLFSWMPAGDLQLDAALQVDPLSMTMVLVVTGVGTLIHLFSVGYMQDDPGYPRYFAYLNLFVFFMLVLVLGASYPVLFVGLVVVGLCSYLLIGFWFSEKANADAV